MLSPVRDFIVQPFLARNFRFLRDFPKVLSKPLFLLFDFAKRVYFHFSLPFYTIPPFRLLCGGKNFFTCSPVTRFRPFPPPYR